MLSVYDECRGSSSYISDAQLEALWQRVYKLQEQTTNITFNVPSKTTDISNHSALAHVFVENLTAESFLYSNELLPRLLIVTQILNGQKWLGNLTTYTTTLENMTVSRSANFNKCYPTLLAIANTPYAIYYNISHLPPMTSNHVEATSTVCPSLYNHSSFFNFIGDIPDTSLLQSELLIEKTLEVQNQMECYELYGTKANFAHTIQAQGFSPSVIQDFNHLIVGDSSLYNGWFAVNDASSIHATFEGDVKWNNKTGSSVQNYLAMYMEECYLHNKVTFSKSATLGGPVKQRNADGSKIGYWGSSWDSGWVSLTNYCAYQFVTDLPPLFSYAYQDQPRTTTNQLSKSYQFVVLVKNTTWPIGNENVNYRTGYDMMYFNLNTGGSAESDGWQRALFINCNTYFPHPQPPYIEPITPPDPLVEYPNFFFTVFVGLLDQHLVVEYPFVLNTPSSAYENVTGMTDRTTDTGKPYKFYNPPDFSATYGLEKEHVPYSDYATDNVRILIFT